MKKMTAYISCMLVCAMLANFASAQTQPTQQVDQNAAQRLTDPVMSERLANDWGTRNSGFRYQPVEWYASTDGYYGTYSKENKNYMTRYDKQGNYVETLTKKDWNDTVSVDLKSSFDKSEYKSHKITSYWKVTDPNKKGYYLELADDQGKTAKVWVDDQGNFSTKPRLTVPTTIK